MRRIGFPAFSNGVICSHGYSHIVDLHRTVRVGGLTIHAGRLDSRRRQRSGHDPARRSRREVADAAAEFVKAEAIVLDYLKAGKPDVEQFAEARKGMMDALGTLGKRLRATR